MCGGDSRSGERFSVDGMLIEAWASPKNATSSRQLHHAMGHDLP